MSITITRDDCSRWAVLRKQRSEAEPSLHIVQVSKQIPNSKRQIHCVPSSKFLYLSSIGSQINLFALCGSCLVYSRMLKSIPSLYQLDASSNTLASPSCENKKCLESLSKTSRGQGRQNHYQMRTMTRRNFLHSTKNFLIVYHFQQLYQRLVSKANTYGCCPHSVYNLVIKKICK